MLASRRTPHLHSVIIAGRGDAGAIGRPCQPPYTAGMALIGHKRFSACGVPDLHSVIIASRGDLLAIGRLCYPIDRATMALVRQERTASRGIPDLYCVIVTARGDALAVGRPRHANGPSCVTAISE